MHPWDWSEIGRRLERCDQPLAARLYDTLAELAEVSEAWERDRQVVTEMRAELKQLREERAARAR